MTRMEKKAFYDRVCFLLTDYEQNARKVTKEELYLMLVDVSLSFDELTGEDE